MRSANLIAGALAATLALGACKSDDTHDSSFADALPRAAQCDWPFEAPVQLEGHDAIVTGSYDCPDPRGCSGKAFQPGTTLHVGLDVDALSSSDLQTELVDDTESASHQTFSLFRNPCSKQPVAEGSVTLTAMGSQVTLEVRDGERVLDRLSWPVARAASVMLEQASASGDAASFTRATQLSPAPGATLQLRAQALDAGGHELVTPDAAFWVEDEELATFDEQAVAGLRATTVELHALAAGSTKLHVLISNVEQVVPLKIE